MKCGKFDGDDRRVDEPIVVTLNGICPGCLRHCRCPKDCMSPPEPGQAQPPARIVKVDWVQLRMPDTIDGLMVNLPTRYLIQDEEQKEKVRAKYRIFDEDMVEIILRELDSNFPTMKDYELGKKDIGDHYLYNVTGYGKFLIKNDCADFKDRAVRFQAMLDVIGEKLRKLLMKHKETALGKLFDVLMNIWNRAGYRWWGDADPREAFFRDMSPAVDGVIKAFRPKIDYPYYELTWEMRLNPSFRGAVRKSFRRWIIDSHQGVNWLLNTPGLPEPGEDEFFSENLD